MYTHTSHTSTIWYMFRLLILMGADSTRQTLQNLLYCWMDTAEGTPVNTQNVTCCLCMFCVCVCVCSVLQYLIVNFWSMPFTTFEFANFYLFAVCVHVCVCLCIRMFVFGCFTVVLAISVVDFTISSRSSPRPALFFQQIYFTFSV